MLYVGLDLSRKRIDFHACRSDGEVVAVGASPPDVDGLRHLVGRLGDAGEVVAVIESMNGARFVHDQLELEGWDVRVADVVSQDCGSSEDSGWIAVAERGDQLAIRLGPRPERRHAERGEGGRRERGRAARLSQQSRDRATRRRRATDRPRTAPAGSPPGA